MSDLADSVAACFSHDQYLIRRKVFKLAGAAFHVFDPAGNVIFYSKLKAFKLKEDIRVFTGEDMKTEVLSIQARQVLDFGASYDILDPIRNEKVGVMRRKGMKSMLRDEWLMLDANEQQIGLIQEDSTAMAIIRRLVDYAAMIFPQKFTGTVNGQTVFQFKQNHNFFVPKISLDYSMDTNRQLDRRMGIAAAVLLGAIEGRQ